MLNFSSEETLEETKKEINIPPPRKPISPKMILWLSVAGVVLLLGTVFFLGFAPGRKTPPVPQEPKKVGILQWIDQVQDLTDGFQDGMAELGYEEGKDVVYVFDPEQIKVGIKMYRDPYAFDEYIKYVVDEDVDLIFTTMADITSAVQRILKETGKEIPVVFGFVGDPVELGLVKSFESSGNNVTGVARSTHVSADVEARKFAFLKQIVPNFKRLGLFTDGFMVDVPGAPAPALLAELRRQAEREGVEIVEYTTNVLPGPGLKEELERVISEIKPGDIDGLYHLPGHYVEFAEDQESRLSIRLGIPYALASLADERRLQELGIGGTFAYYTDRYFVGKQGARMADKIFNGLHPSQIPIEFPEKTTLYVNLNIAEKQGITIPDSMLLIADQVYDSQE